VQGIDFAGQNWLGGTIAAHRWDLFAAYVSLPVIMIVSQLILQKMTQPPAASKPKTGQPDQTQMMSQMMMFMPIMFGYFTLSLPSGLTLYWTVSNVLQIVQQYFITGWGGLSDWLKIFKPRPKPALADTTVVETGASGPVAPKIRRRRRRK
jgi:YidC/Oxa1 family membrane protein insertase